MKLELDILIEKSVNSFDIRNYRNSFSNEQKKPIVQLMEKTWLSDENEINNKDFKYVDEKFKAFQNDFLNYFKTIPTEITDNGPYKSIKEEELKKTKDKISDFYERLGDQQKKIESIIQSMIKIENEDIKPDFSTYFNVPKYISDNKLSFKLPTCDELTQEIEPSDCGRNKWCSHTQIKFIDKSKSNTEKSKYLINLKSISKEFEYEIKNLKFKQYIQILTTEKTEKNFFLNIMYDTKFWDDRLQKLNESLIQYLNCREKNSYKPLDKKCLNPIFIYSNRKNGANMNFMVNLAKQVENILLFLFISGGTPQNREEYQQEIDFYKNYISSIEDKIYFVFLPSRFFSIGCVRKMMMIIADHFKFEKYYIINDKVDQIKEFYYSNYHKNYYIHEESSFRALCYMNIIMDSGIEGKYFVISKSEKELLMRSINQMLNSNSFNDEKEKLKSLKTHLEDKDIEKFIELYLELNLNEKIKNYGKKDKEEFMKFDLKINIQLTKEERSFYFNQ